jgi:hypothetical protein
MEVYGVLGTGGSEYIPKKLVQAAQARRRVSEQFDPAHCWVAIDPASHGTSELGISAFGLNESGVHVILGLASVNVSRCQTSEVQLVIHQMLSRLREHPLLNAGTVFVRCQPLILSCGCRVCKCGVCSRVG